MPDPFDFDDARRALDEVPAPDLWDEASQRAAGGSVVPLESADGRPRRPRWLGAAAVAAVAVLAVGTVAVLLDDDDQAVDTTPVTDPPTGTEDVAVYQATGADCRLGIAGQPLPPPVTISPAEDFSPDNVGTLVEGRFNETQSFAVQVPGQVVTDLIGERVEDVQLERGTGQLWFEGGDADAVQVRWFTGSQEMCESFTVTVGGGSEDANRHAAVDLAERVRLPSELGDLASADLDGTSWQLDQFTVGDIDTGGNGAGFSFVDGEAAWSDGCNSFGATYTQPSPTELVLGDVSSTELPCPTNPSSQAIAAVMSSGTIAVAFGSGVDALFLTAGDTTLGLGPVDAPETTTTIVGDPSAGTELTDTEWRVVALYRGDEEVLLDATAGSLIFTFGDSTVSWDDGCNSASGTWSVDAEGYLVVLVVTDATTTAIGCADVGEGTQVWEVIGAVMGAERIYMDEMGGQVELSDTEGNHITLEPA